MRSDLVFGALSHVSNRYQLCQLASKATRKLHKPNTRLQDTTNDVLYRFRKAHPGTIAAAEAVDHYLQGRNADTQPWRKLGIRNRLATSRQAIL